MMSDITCGIKLLGVHLKIVIPMPTKEFLHFSLTVDAVVTLVFVCCFHLHLAPEVGTLCTLTKKWMAAKC